MSKKKELAARLKKEGLVPDTKKPGEFVKGKNGNRKQDNDDNLKFLDPSNWIFHEQVVEKVLAGDYFEIMPYSGEFVTTMNCSNRCKIPCSYQVPKEIEGCWESNIFSNGRVHMQSVDFGIMLLQKLAEAGIKGITFTGGGEPFLFHGLENLIAEAHSMGIDTALYTNGNSVAQSRLQKAVESKPLLVRLSLNAGTKNVYDNFHMPMNPDNAFKNALASIEFLAKASLANPEMTFGVGIVINEINCNDLVKCAYRLAEISERTGGGISFVTYRPAYNYYGANQLTKDLLDRTHEIVETQVGEVLDRTGIKLSNVSSRYEALKSNTRNYSRCLASGLYYELSPSGNLHICCDRNCHRDYTIGNLTDSSLRDIWQSEQRKKMIEMIDSTEYGLCPPACKPHLTNIQFNMIEELRTSGEMYKAELWIEEQRKCTKPRMVNF